MSAVRAALLAVLAALALGEDIVINIHNGAKTTDGSSSGGTCTADHAIMATPYHEGYTMVSAMFAGSGEWVTKGPLAAPRADCPIVAVGSDIFVIGGTDNNKDPIGTVVKFDTHREVYTDMAAMPAARARMGAAVGGGVIYVVGGCGSGAGTCSANTAAVGSMMGYNIATNTWSTVSGIELKRLDVAVVFLSGKVYVLGGYEEDFSTTHNALVEIDPVAGTMTNKATMTMPRGDAAAAIIDGHIAVVGGWSPANNWAAPLGHLEIWDSRTNAWNSKMSPKWPRGDAALGVLRGRLLLVGGERGHPGESTNEVPVHHVEEYDVQNDIWVEMAPLPSPKFRCSGAVVDDVFYTFGGHGRGVAPSTTVDAYYSIDRPHLFVLRHDC